MTTSQFADAVSTLKLGSGRRPDDDRPAQRAGRTNRFNVTNPRTSKVVVSECFFPALLCEQMLFPRFVAGARGKSQGHTAAGTS
jgi:hypothetical protein